MGLGAVAAAQVKLLALRRSKLTIMCILAGRVNRLRRFDHLQFTT